ncbi:hypothetical protein ABZ341_29670 [Streptomyces sp. NPDC006173]
MVAVLDTGVDAEHPDLLGRIDTSTSFIPSEDVIDATKSPVPASRAR